MNKNIVAVLGLVALVVSGCATQRMTLTSVELNPRAAKEQSREGTVAIAPLAGRLCVSPLGKMWVESEKDYAQSLSPADRVVPSRSVEEKLCADDEGAALYHDLLSVLACLPTLMVATRGDPSFSVDTTPWNGDSGVNYADFVKFGTQNNGKNRRGVLPLAISSDTKPEDVKFDWSILTKDKPIDLSVDKDRAKRLGEKIGCRYLLVPLLVDDFFFTRRLHSIYGIPIMRSSILSRAGDLVLVMVDMDAGSVIDAIRLPRADNAMIVNNKLGVLLSLQKIMDRGHLMGRFAVNPAQQKK